MRLVSISSGILGERLGLKRENGMILTCNLVEDMRGCWKVREGDLNSEWGIGEDDRNAEIGRAHV